MELELKSQERTGSGKAKKSGGAKVNSGLLRRRKAAKASFSPC
jgi:hypothetical protein